MKNFILLFIIYNPLILIAQDNELVSTIVKSSRPEVIKFNSIQIMDFITLDLLNNSDELLGKPLSRSCVQTPVDETCILEYEGFRLTYINTLGEFELYEILLTQSKNVLSLGDTQLTKGMSESEFSSTLDNSRNTLIIDRNSSNTNNEKFGQHRYFIQIFTSDQKVDSVLYRRDLH